MKNHRAFDVLGNIAIVNFHDFSNSSSDSHPPTRQRLRRRQKLVSRDSKLTSPPPPQNKITIKEKKKFARGLLKRNNNIKTVLEKSGRVKGRLRKPGLKYLAGEKTREVLYRENGCNFRFNVDTTYFSPRLSNERKELASKIKKKDNVLVMFAGVAPFSIVIAKKSGAKVVSNEINREANKYAKLNVELNKVKDRVELIGGDVRRLGGKISSLRSQISGSKLTSSSFSLKKSSKLITNSRQSASTKSGVEQGRLKKFDVIVMPRPQLKDSFLDIAFKFSKKGTRIFYYDFCGVDEIKNVVEKIKSEASRARKKIKILKVKKAGEIAPYKIRVRVDFRVL